MATSGHQYRSAAVVDAVGVLVPIVLAGTTDAATNLTTHTDYDALDRKTASIDPLNHKTAYGYDRLGRVTATTANYVDGVWSASNPDQDVTSTFAYDAADELTGYCSAQNRGDAGTSCDPTNAADPNSWQYGYDKAGHRVAQTPPQATLLPASDQLATSLQSYHAGGRLTQACSVPRGTTSCASTATRYTTTGYDRLGRATLVRTYTGARGAGTLRLAWTSTYQGDGFRTRLDFDGSGSSRSEGTSSLVFTPDALDRTTAVRDGAGTLLSGATG